ncbi:MAG: prepilin-type N-terminal cleavage/methylation domain-containing protein, partial [Synergistales bacterium]|nr:prepilin-type N-terminal cleavage/methylation domain-containing protein [Synergistales bacterium]
MAGALQCSTGRPGSVVPGGFHGHAQAGFSLVELLVAMLLIVIIFTAWFRIGNFQTIRKESLRRVALEKAAGYLDIMAGCSSNSGAYRIVFNNAYEVQEASGLVQPMGSPLDPVGYVLRVEERAATNGWPASTWATI